MVWRVDEAMTMREIGAKLGISVEMVERYYAAELALAAKARNDKVASTLYAMAASGKNTVASIYWTKTQINWVEATIDDRPPPTPPPHIIVEQVKVPPLDLAGIVTDGPFKGKTLHEWRSATGLQNGH